jgi:hypothetical protein
VLKAPGSCLGSIYNWFRPALVNVTLSRLNSNVFQDNFGARGTSFLDLRRSRRPLKAFGSPCSVLGRNLPRRAESYKAFLKARNRRLAKGPGVIWVSGNVVPQSIRGWHQEHVMHHGLAETARGLPSARAGPPMR